MVTKGADQRREWRQAGGYQSGMLSTAQAVHDPIPIAPSHQPSSSTAKRGSIPGPKGKKQKPGQVLPPLSGPTGRGQVANWVSSGNIVIP
uniref:Uncharacterized protein n=1 Tax=Fagus sylvatica TaxID=28930 RepID=A0A2N9H074_FAGSY